MNPDDLNTNLSDDQKKARRFDQLIARGVDPQTAAQRVAREFRPAEIAALREIAQESPLAAAIKSVGAGASHLAGSVPGGQTLATAMRYVGSRGPLAKPDDRETWEQARQAVQGAGQEYASENPRAAAALSLLGGGLALGTPLGYASKALSPLAEAPAAVNILGRGAKALPSALLGAGTAGAYRALDVTPETGETLGQRLAQRAAGTAGAATIGLGMGAVAPWLFEGGGAVPTLGRGLLGGTLGYQVGGVPGAVAGAGGMARPDVAVGIAAKAAQQIPASVMQGALQLAERVGARGATQLPQRAGELRQTMGERGIVNREMQNIQDLMTPVGGIVGAPSAVAEQNIAAANRFRDESNRLFEIAKASPKIVTNPEIRQFINDPDVSAVMDMAKQIRIANGGKVPTVTEMRALLGPEQAVPMGTAQAQAPSFREALDAFRNRIAVAVSRKEGTTAQQSARRMLERRSGEIETILGGGGFPIRGDRTLIPGQTRYAQVTEEVPDPELLHLAKRIMQDIVDKKIGGDRVIPLQDALRISPKLDQLRNYLHSESPEFARADRFMRLGRVAEEGFNRGFTAAGPGMTRPSANQLTEETVAGSRAFANDLEDDELRRIASEAVSRGARGQMLQQMTSRGIGEGARGVLGAPILAQSPEAYQQRQLALGPQAEQYGKTLTNIRATEQGSRANLAGRIASRATGLAEAAAAPSVGTSRRQQEMLDRVLARPQDYQQTLAQFRRGMDIRQALRGALGGAVVSPFAQRFQKVPVNTNASLLPGEDPI